MKIAKIIYCLNLTLLSSGQCYALIDFSPLSFSSNPYDVVAQHTATVITVLDNYHCQPLIQHADATLDDASSSWYKLSTHQGKYHPNASNGIGAKVIDFNANQLTEVKYLLQSAPYNTNCIDQLTLVTGAPQDAIADQITGGTLIDAGQYQIRSYLSYPNHTCLPSHLRSMVIVMNIKDQPPPNGTSQGNQNKPVACEYAIDFGSNTNNAAIEMQSRINALLIKHQTGLRVNRISGYTPAN